jgi:hypothetical protein
MNLFSLPRPPAFPHLSSAIVLRFKIAEWGMKTIVSSPEASRRFQSLVVGPFLAT